MNKRRQAVAQFVLICMAVYTPVSEAYDLFTHAAINVGGVTNSRLDSRLRTELDFPTGVEETIDGKRVIDWIREGGVLEDIPFRFLHHFHHPLRSPWRNAGLNDVFTGSSSILWSQDSTQGFSWINARQAYYIALAGADKRQRERAFADTFRSLGQVMHLIADSSVPAHVRNDQHGGGDPFEEWVEFQAKPRAGEPVERARERFIGTFIPSVIFPDDSFILTLPNATDAPIPIARLWDTDQYHGTNPLTTLSPRIGMTEYANANFFSEDTAFANEKDISHKHFSPFPSSTDVDLWVDPANNRKYWRKKATTPGEPHHLAEHLGTASKRTDWQESSGIGLPKRARLDEKVHEDYARLLIPRAVGYSAVLLDYFFRGRLQPTFVPDPNGGRELILKTRKLGTEPIGPGSLRLLYDDADGVRHPIQEQPVPDLGEASDLPDIRFDIPEGTPSQYVVVYRGRLGLEADAVAARVFGGLPIVAVQEAAVLTGEELISETSLQRGRRKDPNHQRAEGSFWVGGSAEVGKKIREVRLEEAKGDDGLSPAKTVLRLNGKEVGTHWRAADDPALLPERWEVVLSPIPGETSEFTVVPPPAIRVNDFRTPLLWIERASSGTDQFPLPDLRDGLRVWITTRTQSTQFHFGDGLEGLDANFVTPVATPRTRVSFRPVGEVAGLAVPQAHFEFLQGSCSLHRTQFLFAWRRVTGPFEIPRCEIGAEVFWAKNFLTTSERMMTVGEQPDPAAPPLLTGVIFRREFLDADLQRFLGVGVAPPQYEIQTQ